MYLCFGFLIRPHIICTHYLLVTAALEVDDGRGHEVRLRHALCRGCVMSLQHVTCHRKWNIYLTSLLGQNNGER